VGFAAKAQKHDSDDLQHYDGRTACRNPASFAVALYCGIRSSSLNALVNVFERLQMVRHWNSSVHHFCRLEPVPVSIQQLVPRRIRENLVMMKQRAARSLCSTYSLRRVRPCDGRTCLERVSCQTVARQLVQLHFAHHLAPGDILALCAQLYSAQPRGFLISGHGECFGQSLSLSLSLQRPN
jgi:hypothetical protein